jgi:hypothetical protein
MSKHLSLQKNRRMKKTSMLLMWWLLSSGCKQESPEFHLEEGECFHDSDCLEEEVCFDVDCLRASQDANADNPCTGACFRPQDVAYCKTNDDCIEFGESLTCRTDPRFCVDDLRTDEGDCVGWCVGFCGQSPVIVSDPNRNRCYISPDTCTPPGFPVITNPDSCTFIQD